MTDEDRQALYYAKGQADQAASDVQEIMASMTRLRTSLEDAQGRSQAAQARLTTLQASLSRKYGREAITP